MRIIYIAIFMLLNICLHAQDTLRKDSATYDYTTVRVPAPIEGGQKNWIQFLEKIFTCQLHLSIVQSLVITQ